MGRVGCRSNGFIRRCGLAPSAMERITISLAIHEKNSIQFNNYLIIVGNLHDDSSCGGAVGLNVPCEFDWSTGLSSGVVSS